MSTEKTAKLKPGVAVTAVMVNANQIISTGTVANDNNPVLCVLTPINTDGSLRSGATITPPQNQFAVAISTTTWEVRFTPPTGMTYSGLYSVTATANAEGSASMTGSHSRL